MAGLLSQQGRLGSIMDNGADGMQARGEGVSYLSEGPGLWGSLTGGTASAGRAAASVSTAGACCSCEAETISRPSQKGSSTSSVGSRACFERCFMRSSSHRLMPTQKYCAKTSLCHTI